jgi:hypothetical protein
MPNRAVKINNLKNELSQKGSSRMALKNKRKGENRKSMNYALGVQYHKECFNRVDKKSIRHS